MRPRGRNNRSNRKKGRVAFTYYRSAQTTPSKSPFQKKKPAKKGLRLFLVKTADTATLILILVLIGYSLVIKPHPSVSVSDQSYRPSGTYHTAAAAELQALVNRNKLTIDEKSISDSIKSQFPEVAAVSVDTPILGQTPKFNIKVNSPAIFLQSGGDTFIIDASGKAIGQPDSFPGVSNLPAVEDRSGFGVKQGEQVLSTPSMSFIISVIQQLNAGSVPIDRIVIPAQALEVDVYPSPSRYFVKFYLGGDALQQTGQFLAIRNDLEKSTSQPKEYIDVRVAGKVFYK